MEYKEMPRGSGVFFYILVVSNDRYDERYPVLIDQ